MASSRNHLSGRPGTYALVLACSSDAGIRAGSGLALRLQPGFYVYVGSAFGPGGIAARVRRHAAPGRRHHWHIDRLRTTTSLEELWLTYDPCRREHDWAAALLAMRGAEPVPRFGSSDCACRSHLFRFAARPALPAFSRRVHALVPGHRTVRRAPPPELAR